MSTPALQPGVTPYLVVADAAAAIAFYEQGLGAALTMRLDLPDGRVAHAEMRVEGQTFMLASAFPERGQRAPEPTGSAVTLQIMVPDCDAALARAEKAGAIVTRAAADQFWGARMAEMRDPHGHSWALTEMKEQVSPEAVQQRFQSMLAGPPPRDPGV